MLSFAEENYLKAIHNLSEYSNNGSVNTNALADALNTKAASVSDMVKKLAKKKMVYHVRYKGVTITKEGREAALRVIRKHRLWETFLVRKLNFQWHEVHEVAEQLEHIRSPLLISRLDKYLGYPKVDPHGDPIPNEQGKIEESKRMRLNEMPLRKEGVIVAVNDSSSEFLRYLDKIGAYLGAKVKVLEKVKFDDSLEILINTKKKMYVSREVSENILVTA